ncbi:MAG: SAM-dependent DNA methyltransferase, partial [Asticcacaulis sp.]|nr:SAM-dependent DNA methyltransferase [Asticcacaulis sp.]
MSANLNLFAGSAISRSAGILSAARSLLPALARGKQLDRNAVRDAMTFSFMGADREGLWTWKDAYDAIEVAQVLHLRKIAYQVARIEDAPLDTVLALQALNRLGLTHTRRSEEQIALDQFSTPPELAALAVLAAQVRDGDTVLEPSAGTGMLAVLAELAGATLHVNELAPSRADLLDELFSSSARSRLDAATLHDRVLSAGSFDAVVLNPPFQQLDAHLLSAGKCLADGGRVSAIVPARFFESAEIQRLARVFSVRAAIVFPDGAYSKHGTGIETGLLVLDRLASGDRLPPI